VIFSKDQRAQIRQALNSSLGVTDTSIQDKIISEIETSEKIRAFGYGSLITYAHTEDVTNSSPAVLNGWSRGMVCFDTFYRGTPENPGLTMGLDEGTESDKTFGAVLETQLDPSDMKKTTDRVIDYIEKFGARERPPNMPIYTFQLQQVDLIGGDKVNAITCVADCQSELYVGQMLSLEEKAEIIAKSMGNPEGRDIGKVTDLDYLKGVIDSSIDQNIPVESNLHDLYLLSVMIRENLSPEIQERLEEYEPVNSHGQAPPLFAAFVRAVGEHNARLIYDKGNSTLGPAKPSLN
jgi:cation transport protein ChaC